MIQIGTRVKVLDNYFGGLEGVVGQMGKVTRVIHTAPECENQYVLDILGLRTKTIKSAYSQTEEQYTYSYNVIVNQSEVEEVSYGFTDRDGQPVELGDIIVYGVSGGGILKGTVVDFKETVRSRWGRTNNVLKMKIEMTNSYTTSDGGDRSVEVESKSTIWLSNQNQTLIFQKNPANQFIISIGNDKMVYGHG